MRASVQLLTGPASSGKTAAAVRHALACAAAGERVIVLTLPAQRVHWLERLADAGPSVGVEVTNLQNVCYRMLDRLGENRAVVLNPGRVALAARALEVVRGAGVSPGEARLYARAIAECKRFGVVPEVTGDPYQNTLAAVFAQYAQLLEEQALQDLDDVRVRATELLRSSDLTLGAHLIVDGYRSFASSELEAVATLADLSLGALVTLPAGSPDTHREAWAHPLRPDDLERVRERLNGVHRRLEGTGAPWRGLPGAVVHSAHPNPVGEARACLRRVKSLLRDGVRPQRIAIVVPHAPLVRVLEALAREYGVPVAPESAGSFLESPDGRIVDALLGAPAREYPARELRTLSRLEPSLTRLADALEQHGIASGGAAYRLVVDDPEALAALERIQALAAPAQGSAARMLEWFEATLEATVSDHRLRDAARVTAREAVRIMGGNTLDGNAFCDWLRSLLGALGVPHPDAGRGVGIYAPEEVSGRRFQHVFVLHAVDGAYRAGEAEDFFVPEEERHQLAVLLGGVPGLPQRLSGLEDSALYDCLTRADSAVYISAPRAERGTSLRPHPRLAQLGVRAQAEESVTASPLELAHARSLRDPLQELIALHGLPLPAVTRATELERYAICGVQAWAQTHLPQRMSGNGLVPGNLLDQWTRKVRGNVWRAGGKATLEVAPSEHRHVIDQLSPAFRTRLEDTVEARVPPVPELGGIKLGFKDARDGIEYVLDGARFKPSDADVRRVEIYRHVDNAEDGYAKLMQDDRHREWWYAHAWQQEGISVNLMVMDFHSAPRRPFDLSKPYAVARMARSAQTFEDVRASLERGELKASPGFHCGACAYRDLCRVAD
jgi:hypothetical protein